MMWSDKLLEFEQATCFLELKSKLDFVLIHTARFSLWEMTYIIKSFITFRKIHLSLDAADTISAKIFGIVLYFDINIINVQFKKWLYLLIYINTIVVITTQWSETHNLPKSEFKIIKGLSSF